MTSSEQDRVDIGGPGPSGWKPVFPAAITSVLFSGSFLAGRVAVDAVRPLTLTWLRYVIAVIVLGMMTGRSLPPRGWWKKHLLSLMLLGVTGIVGYHFFFFKSLTLTTVTNTAIINAASPVVTGVLASLLLRERLSAVQYLGILSTVVGTMLLVSRGTGVLLTTTVSAINGGDLLMMLAVMCWAVYAIVLRKTIASLSSQAATLGAMIVGVVMLTPLMFSEAPVSQLSNLSVVVAVSIVYMGTAASGLGYLLYTVSVRNIGPTRTAGIVYSLVPVLVALLSAVIFDEAVTAVTAASMGCVVGGLVMMQRGSKQGNVSPKDSG